LTSLLTFLTIPRAREFAFSTPYAYFADGIGVVRADEKRFTNFDSLDTEGVTIAVGQGWPSETLVKSRFTKARIVSVQTATDLQQLFNEVLSGRADIAVADGADAERFVREHRNQVKGELKVTRGELKVTRTLICVSLNASRRNR
jgi:cyclohexadienyl dehydratase